MRVLPTGPVQSTDVHCHLYIQYIPYHTCSSILLLLSIQSPSPIFSFPAPPWLCTLPTVQLRIFTSRSKAIKHAFKHTWQLPGERQGRGISTNQIDSFRKHRHGSRELRLTRKISFPDKLTLMLTGTLTDNRRKTDRNVHLPVSGFLVGAKEGRRGEEEEEIRRLRFGRFFGRKVRVFD